MVALIFMVAFESLAVTTVMPTVSDALDGASLYAFAFAGPLATGVVGHGRWPVRGATAAGRGRPAGGGRAVHGWASSSPARAPSMGVLVAGRLLQGFGGGAMTVALYVVVARLYPAMLHPRVFAWFAAAWIIPSLVGPAGAGAVAQHAGWRWVFLGVALLVVPTTLVLVPALRRIGPPETPRRAAPRGRLAWATLAAAAVLGLNLAAQVPLPWSVVVAVGTAVVALVALRRRRPGRHAARGARPAERHRDARPGRGGVPRRRGVPAVPAHGAVRVLADDRGDRPDVRRGRLGGDVVAAGAPRRPAAVAGTAVVVGSALVVVSSRACCSTAAGHLPRRGRDRALDPRRRGDGPGLLPADRPRARLLRPGDAGREQLGPVDRGLDRRASPWRSRASRSPPPTATPPTPRSPPAWRSPPSFAVGAALVGPRVGAVAVRRRAPTDDAAAERAAQLSERRHARRTAHARRRGRPARGPSA